MRYTIEDNSSEKIDVKTDEFRFSIVTTFKGSLPEYINDKKTSTLNEEQLRRLLPIANCWLSGRLRDELYNKVWLYRD